MNRSSLRGGASRVRRFAAFACATLFLTGIVASLVQAQISEEDKKRRDAFLKAREEMRTIASPTPADASTPSGKPKPATKKPRTGKSPTPASKRTPGRAKSPAGARSDDDEEAETAGSPKKASPAVSPGRRASTPEETPIPTRRATPEETATRAAVPTATVEPRSTATRVAPVATPPAAAPDLPADITIEKSGLEEEQGFEPPPPPPPRRRFLFWSFGRRPSYRYLSNNVIEAIRRAPVQRARWKFIIIHNSGTKQGNARAFDYYHRRVRRMQNGMAYHFVVGNGTSSGDGHIEIGDRWRRQINGGHVHSDYLNNISLGICLVGDFNRQRPTRAQLEATEELIKYLRQRCGKMDVRPHKEMNPPRRATDCPGDAFPYSWFRRF